jgi:uncharacterized protein (TIGR03083 family)
MDVSDHVADLKRDGALLAQAVDSAGPDAAVPTCPEWSLRDLAHHLGGVHRWATAIVARPVTEYSDIDFGEIVGPLPADAALTDWFRHGHEALVAVLSQADPELACWTFLSAPSPLAMWARRQAHETAIHRVDAELAAGGPISPVPAVSAADGVDELLTCFATRRGGRLNADPPRRLLAQCTDAVGAWLVEIGPDGVRTTPGTADAPCTVSGTARDLYLTLWNRRGADDLAVDGDRDVLELFLDRVHVNRS